MNTDDLCFPPVQPELLAEAAAIDRALKILGANFGLRGKAAPKGDGWIAWEGGECPIPHAKAGEWEAKERNGKITTQMCDAAADAWDHRPDCDRYDIVAYRLKPATAATVDGWDLGHFPTEPIPAADDRKTAQEYAAALNGDDDPVQDTDRPGIANAAMFKAMTTPKPVRPAPRDELGLLTVAPMGSHARGWGL